MKTINSLHITLLLLVLLAPILTLIGCGDKKNASQTVLSKIDPQQTRKNSAAKIEALLKQMTLKEKVSMVHANSKFAIASIERLGIHEMWMSDGPHGVRQEISRNSWSPAGWTDDHSTYLPPLTAVAASWDLNMASLHGNVLGSEARHRRKDIILGPGMNLARLPIYGRNFEYFGEDPYLVSKMVVPEIIAIQKNDVAANAKHYALNTQELNRHGVNATPDERTLREVYLPAFEAAVKEADVQTVMGAYNNIRGTNANQNKHLVNGILKEEWGFKGALITDWDVNINTYDAAMNGLDIEMGTRVKSYDQYHFADPLHDMITEGQIPMSVLDDKIRRILGVQFKIGMMDKNRLSGQRNTLEHRLAAQKIAESGVVLLKNENQVLPLVRSSIKNLLVLGPNADKKHGTGGGSSQVKSLHEVTPLQGLQEKLGEDVNITYMQVDSGAGLLPIAGEFIASRSSGAGTPAWRSIIYKKQERAVDIDWSWLPDSQFKWPTDTPIQYATLSADIQPLADGEHVLKYSAIGKVRLKIDGKVVFSNNLTNLAVHEKAISLKKDQLYKFELEYDGNQEFILGWDAPGSSRVNKDVYTQTAKEADAVIYFAGLSHADDRESKDRIDMVLPNLQDSVIDDLLKANPNTVVFMIAGSAVEMPWADKANAIVWGWYGGMEAGHAYANILLGDINPSGKMPITLPKRLSDTAPLKLNDYNANTSLYKEGVFIGHRWFEQQNIQPLFPFGHGLSYSQFNYDLITLSNKTFQKGEDLTVQVKVTNTGDVAGAEVVQLYLNDVKASVERPHKELKGFSKVFLQPQESATVEMTLTQRDLSFWDVKSSNWLVESGEFNIYVGSSSNDIRLTNSFNF